MKFLQFYLQNKGEDIFDLVEVRRPKSSDCLETQANQITSLGTTIMKQWLKRLTFLSLTLKLELKDMDDLCKMCLLSSRMPEQK